MRGHLGSLVLADALPALGGELADEPEQPRAGDQQDADECCADRERTGAGLRERIVGGEERGYARDDETDAAEDDEERPPPAQPRAVAAGGPGPPRPPAVPCAPPAA